MIQLATRGKFDGGLIGMTTFGKFNHFLLRTLKTWIVKSIKYLWTSKDLLGR